MACPISWRRVSFTRDGNAVLSMTMLHVWPVHPVNVPKVLSWSTFPMLIVRGIRGDFSVGLRRLFHCLAAHSASLQIFGAQDSTHAIVCSAARAAARVYGQIIGVNLK